LIDLREMIRDPNKVVDMCHVSNPGFINSYTNKIAFLLTDSGKFEVAISEEVEVKEGVKDRLEQSGDVPTKYMEVPLGEDNAVLALFDHATYHVLVLVMWNGERGRWLAWPSPLGITPENAWLMEVGQNPDGRLYVRESVWAGYLLVGGRVSWEARITDQREFSVLGHEVEIDARGVKVDGRYRCF